MKTITVAELKSGDVIIETDMIGRETLIACEDAQPYTENGIRTGWTCQMRYPGTENDGNVRVLAIDKHPAFAPDLALVSRAG